LDNLGRSPDGLRPDWFRAEKFHVPVTYAQTPLPLARLCVLEHDEAAAIGQFRRLAGAHALNAIVTNSFPPEYFETHDGRESHFQQCAVLARTIEVFELRQNRNLSPFVLRSLWQSVSAWHSVAAQAGGYRGSSRARG